MIVIDNVNSDNSNYYENIFACATMCKPCSQHVMLNWETENYHAM